MNTIQWQVFTLQSANKTIRNGDFFSATWQTKFTNSEIFFLSFPRYRHICLMENVPVTQCPRYRPSQVIGIRFQWTNGVPVTCIYCVFTDDVHRFFPRFLIDVSTCYDVIIRYRFKIALSAVPTTKTIWWGKVGKNDFDSYTAIMPTTSLPITSIYMNKLTHPYRIVPLISGL